MELRIRFSIEVPDARLHDGEIRRAARHFLLMLAAELIRCSVRWESGDDDDAGTVDTTEG